MAMRTATLAAVRDLIARVLEVDRSLVVSETRLIQDLGADSIDRLEVATELEEEFGVSLSDDQIQRMNTVHDAAEMVTQAK
jgi:acyl carrier protein